PAKLLFALFSLGDMEDGADATDESLILVELEVGLLAHPSHRSVDDNAVLDIVGMSVQRGVPLAVDVFSIVRVNASEECVVGHGGPRCDPEDPIDLVGPAEHVVADVEAPASDA